MDTKLYYRNGEEFIIEELTRKEFKELAEWFIDDMASMAISSDDTLFIAYSDGTTLYVDDGNFDGRYRKTGISFGLITNGSTQQVFGRYAVDENGMVQMA